MSILKNKLKAKFSQLPNELITDTRLSNGAFRVAAYLFSRPDGWNILNADIQKQLGIKQPQKLADYWNELIKCGWIERERKRENGKIVGGFDYELSLFSKNPHYEKHLNTENPYLGETLTHSNTEFNSKKEYSTKTEPKEVPPVGDRADFEDYENLISENEAVENSVTEILEALNLYAGRNLPVKGERSAASRKKIKLLLRKKYTPQEMKEVIQCKCFEWGNDAKMAQYLHPTTLFVSGNFQKYLDQVNDLKNNPEKAKLFKKKINGNHNGELISQQSLTNISTRIIDDMRNGRPL